jgi:hypothetical protein
VLPEPQLESGLAAAARALAARAAAADVVAIERLAGGRNNRAYRLNTRERPLFLKVYHSDTADPRPRLHTEFAFLRYAWERGIRVVPEPIAADFDNNLGLYGFVEGRRLGASEAGREHIEQAARLLAELNRGRGTAAAALPAASEACFSFGRHLALIEERVRRLQSIDGPAEVSSLLRDRLAPLWRQVSERARRRAAVAGIIDEPELPAGDRCLSPSDFGFHNAIADENGRLTFHDFEYAGWDDAAKLVCDFLCQPEVPVAAADADFAIDCLLAAAGRPTAERSRIELLYPLYAVKWCCICLNDFLPPAARRRDFAGCSGGEWQHAQLAKVRELMLRLE